MPFYNKEMGTVVSPKSRGIRAFASSMAHGNNFELHYILGCVIPEICLFFFFNSGRWAGVFERYHFSIILGGLMVGVLILTLKEDWFKQ